MTIFTSPKRRERLIAEASAARAMRTNMIFAFAVVSIYNFVGIFDIISTIAAIELGVAEEANPIMRAMMEQYGVGWVAAKLFLQITISAMVLWFPHRIVLLIFTFSVWVNGFIVLNNFRIALGLS